MARIAVGGLRHATNTFAPFRTGLAQFEQPAVGPALTQGDNMLSALAGMNLPASGFIAKAAMLGHEIAPLLWAEATSAGPVTRQAFETLCGGLLDALRQSGPLDGVYLDLHGAMAAEHLDDGEGEILRRVRQAIGQRTPLLASLAPQANVSPLMMEQASALAACRGYPHVDMAQTGARLARLLNRLLAGQPLYKAFQPLPFLIPLPWQCTLRQPMIALLETMQRLETGAVHSLSFTPGFPLADVACCGPAVFAYGGDQATARRAVDELARAVLLRESQFTGVLRPPDEAVRHALASAVAGRSVILADFQDNPDDGGGGDTVGLLQALLRHPVEDAVMGVLYEPQAAAQAHAAGEGAVIAGALGAHSGFTDESLAAGPFTVERLGDGRLVGTGPYCQGRPFQLGPMALLRRDGVRIVVASRRAAANDQAIFRHVGIEPAAHSILALKSAVQFRADFSPIAGDIVLVEAAGARTVDPAELPFHKLRQGVRLRPLQYASAPVA